jgi:TctA family transporter
MISADQWLHALASATTHMFSWPTLLAMAIMLPIALLSGLMPGSHLPVIVVLLTLSGFMNYWVAVPLFVFYHSCHEMTEAVPSILLGIPGGRASQATILDGYPLTRQGKSGIALGASYTSSFLGAIISAFLLLLSIPIASTLLKYFDSPELFILSVIGVLTIGVVSSGAMVKGLLVGCFAFGVAMIGLAPIDGSVRLIFGLEYLENGIPLTPVVVGLFAVPEAIALIMRGRPISPSSVSDTLKDSRGQVFVGMRRALRHKALILKSSLLGAFLSMVPGIGGSGGHWIAYAQARNTEKDARKTFGTGDIRGVIAAEAASNGSDAADLVPTLLFGIPGSAGKAFLLAILILSGGILPGEGLIRSHLDLLVALVITVLLAAVVVVPVMSIWAPIVSRAIAIPPNVLAPIIIAIVVLSSFLTNYNIYDVFVAFGFAILGMFMKAYGWPRPPLLIALVLAQNTERYLSISLNGYTPWAMILRPGFLGIAAAFVLFVVFAAVRGRGIKKVEQAVANASSAADVQATQDADSGGANDDDGARLIGQRRPVDSASGTNTGSSDVQRLPELITATAAEVAPTESSPLSTAAAAPLARIRHRIEVAGDALLMTIILAFFVYMWVDSRNWDDADARLPRIVAVAGAVVWAVRMLSLVGVKLPGRRLSQHGISRPGPTLMDVGFGESDDPRQTARRMLVALAYIATLLFGVWAFGFKIAIPVVVAGYLFLVGKTKWYLAVAVGVGFALLTAFVLSDLVYVPWPIPALNHVFPNYCANGC